MSLIGMKALGMPAENVNANGEAIAHGYPLGARYGLQTICISQGMATVIELL